METYFDNMTLADSSEQLLGDLKNLRAAAEDLVKATATTVADKSRLEVHRAISKLKATCDRLEETTVANARNAGRLVRNHPYPSLGVAFGLGLLVGLWVQRK